MAESVFIAAFIVWVLAWGWYMICIYRTYNQRIKILERMKLLPYNTFTDFDKVSFDAHLWALFTFKKPKYPPSLGL